MREKFNVSEDDWEAKVQFITAEHDKDGARQQLIDEWKSWIQARHAQGGGGEGGAAMARDSLNVEEVDE